MALLLSVMFQLFFYSFSCELNSKIAFGKFAHSAFLLGIVLHGHNHLLLLFSYDHNQHYNNIGKLQEEYYKYTSRVASEAKVLYSSSRLTTIRLYTCVVHLSSLLSQFPKSIIARIIETSNNEIPANRYIQRFNHMSTIFSINTDICNSVD